jgi:hypothetical protein
MKVITNPDASASPSGISRRRLLAAGAGIAAAIVAPRSFAQAEG